MGSMVTEWPQYFTATNLERKKLLQPDKYKEIIIDSLRFLVSEKRITLYGFVIMANHIHLIWRMCAGIDPEDLQREFLKYTSQKIKADLRKYYPEVLENFRVNAKGRKYQFWERNPLRVESRKHSIFLQKFEYIYQNPVTAGLCSLPEEYKYSSAGLYQKGIDQWGFISHYRD